MMARRRAFGWVHYGPWEYARTLDTYYQAHQDLLSDKPRLDLLSWNVRTNTMTRRAALPAPARLCPGSEVENSIVSGGCRIEGRVEGSVLSPGVVVGKGAVVKNSILWDMVEVKPGAVVDRIICDKRSVIGEGAHVGVGDTSIPNDEQAKSLATGVTVLGMDVRVPPGAEISRNCVIYPRASEAELTAPVGPGKTIHMPLSWYGEVRP
jgi:glucose-1-phosphate adenylyltransferase